MSAAFERAWSFLQRDDIEGGARISRDPADPGGTTRWGISQRAFPQEDIENMTEGRARELFRLNYWNPGRLSELPGDLAVAVADGAFNHGLGTAIRLLQQAVRVDTDGTIGPTTLSAVRRIPESELINEFLSRRAARYADGAPKYRRGWMLRLFKLREFLS